MQRKSENYHVDSLSVLSRAVKNIVPGRIQGIPYSKQAIDMNMCIATHDIQGVPVKLDKNTKEL